MQKHRILVIGSKGHQRAECIDWLEPFPNIEECDSVIINMQSLSQEYYDKIQNKIGEMKESISTIIDTEREIFCVLDKIRFPSPPRPSRTGYVNIMPMNPDYVSPTNYDWLPARINLDDKKSGDYVSLRNSKFKDYFGLIQKWVFEIGFNFEVSRVSPNFLNVIEPIAVNKSEKIIAGSLHRISDRKKSLNGERIGMVHLLPPPEKDFMFQAIERIIDIVIGNEAKEIAPWRKEIDIPLDRDLREKAEKKLGEMKKIQEEIASLQEQIQSHDCYRDLLTETGEPLENIVQKTLKDIGIITEKTGKGFPADLVNREVAIEITGIKGSVGVDSNKVTQTGRFIQNYRKQEKVVLIVNTYMDTVPKDRKGKMNFSPQMKDYLKSLSVSYMTAQSLFELWKDVTLGRKKIEEVKQKILGTIGEVTA